MFLCLCPCVFDLEQPYHQQWEHPSQLSNFCLLPRHVQHLPPQCCEAPSICHYKQGVLHLMRRETEEQQWIQDYLERQCSRSRSDLFCEVMKNRDGKDLSSLNWNTWPSTFFQHLELGFEGFKFPFCDCWPDKFLSL